MEDRIKEIKRGRMTEHKKEIKKGRKKGRKK